MKDYGSNPGIFKKWLRNYKVARHRPKIWRLSSPDVAYIKITKVASTSVELTLARHLHSTLSDGKVEEVNPKMVRHYADIYAKHQTLKDFMASSRPPFVFSFVRNPLDRLYSSYMDKIQDVRNSGQTKNIFWNLGITLDMNFEDFVARVAEIPDEKIDRHLRSQSAFLCEDEHVVVDYVGKFERMSEDWKYLSDKFNLPDLPHKNKSSKSEAATPYTLSAAKIAAQRYKKDIELFGYSEQVDSLITSLK
jgi:hypothetical protein